MARRMTMKQQEALHLLARGHTSKEIGRIVGVSASAIDQRIDCVARATGAGDRRALIRWYLDSSEQSTADAAQVVSARRLDPPSDADQKAPQQETGDVKATSHQPELVVLTIPETWSANTKMRQALEAAFFVIMIALGAGALLDKLT